jgi:hypothetical protein
VGKFVVGLAIGVRVGSFVGSCEVGIHEGWFVWITNGSSVGMDVPGCVEGDVEGALLDNIGNSGVICDILVKLRAD